MTPPLTFTATLQNAAGVAAAKPAKVRLTLCATALLAPSVLGSIVFGELTITLVADNTGKVTTPIWGNDIIQPTETFYLIEIVDARENVIAADNYQLTGSGTVDLSTLTPYRPQLVEINDLVEIPYAANAVYDFSLGNAFEMMLTGNAAPQFLNLVSGKTFVMIFMQDSAGGRSVTWPQNVHNPADVNSSPFGLTVQKFVVAADGTVRPVTTAQYA